MLNNYLIILTQARRKKVMTNRVMVIRSLKPVKEAKLKKFLTLFYLLENGKSMVSFGAKAFPQHLLPVWT